LAKSRIHIKSVSSHPFAIAFITLLLYAALTNTTKAAAPAADDSLLVTTKSGQLHGASRPTGGAEFLAIPYAQPPIGDLRWHEPLPTKPWSGVRDASTFGAPCSQPILGTWNLRDSETSKEDCLFLNVITPVWPPKSPLPVMFWLHGGANTGGTASSALYKDGTLVQHGVLLVTVNYRLGVFGFLAHPALTRESPRHASGNYGLMDQILALRWVHDNIAQFGGDPNNITVFGQSAGAVDTGLLMTSPLSKEMFRRAIAESGAAFTLPLPSLPNAEKDGEILAAILKAPSGDDAIKFLRQMSSSDILTALSKQAQTEVPDFGPDIDGWVVPHSPATIFTNGEESVIPLIVGTTAREFGMSASPDELRKRIENATGDLANKALPLYGLDKNNPNATTLADPLYGTAADQWLGDFLFRCPVTTEAAWHAAAHHPTYEYEFAHAIPGHESEGAVHSADLPYVFGFYPTRGNIGGTFTEADHKLADLIETYWTNFAKTGNPNSPTQPQWPEFDKTQTYIQFTQAGEVKKSQSLREKQCDLYREVLKEHMHSPQ
jgi:para-nitrobenzyl esterase